MNRQERSLKKPPVIGAVACPRLVDFIAGAWRYGTSGEETDAVRLLDSPYAGLSRLDARAIVVAAASDSLAATIDRGAPPLAHDARIAASRFARALDDLRTGAAAARRARERFDGIVRTFALDRDLGTDERAVLDAAARICDEADADGIRTDDAALARLVGAFAGLPVASPPKPVTPPDIAPETPYPVPRFAGPFSASALGTYAACERQWYYRYLCGVVEDPGSAAATYGSAMHEALERFHNVVRRYDGESPESLANRLDADVIGAFETFRRSFATAIECELALRRARRTARRYLEWWIARARRRPLTIAGIEERVDVEFDGIPFVGYIDRLDRDDESGAFTVVDYKTGSIAESAADYRKGVAEHRDFQLPLYFWAVTERGGIVERLMLVPLKDPALDVAPIELNVVAAPASTRSFAATSGDIGIEALARARERMIAIARLLTRGEHTAFAPTTDPHDCRYCVYARACRDRPPDPPDRFGR